MFPRKYKKKLHVFPKIRILLLMNINAFWHRVKVRAKEKFVTQDTVAKAAGLSPIKLRVWMSKNMVPPLSYAYRLSQYLGVSLEYLINGKDADKASQVTKTNKEILVLLKDANKTLAEIRHNFP